MNTNHSHSSIDSHYSSGLFAFDEYIVPLRLAIEWATSIKKVSTKNETIRDEEIEPFLSRSESEFVLEKVMTQTQQSTKVKQKSASSLDATLFIFIKDVISGLVVFFIFLAMDFVLMHVTKTLFPETDTTIPTSVRVIVKTSEAAIIVLDVLLLAVYITRATYRVIANSTFKSPVPHI